MVITAGVDMELDLLILNLKGAPKVIRVESYGYLEEGKMFYFVKNGYRSFIPASQVTFFGREFDWSHDDGNPPERHCLD